MEGQIPCTSFPFHPSAELHPGTQKQGGEMYSFAGRGTRTGKSSVAGTVYRAVLERAKREPRSGNVGLALEFDDAVAALFREQVVARCNGDNGLRRTQMAENGPQMLLRIK